MAVFAVASPTFQPAMRIVTAITNAYPASITTSFDHDYINGEIVRFFIPLGFGIPQLHNKKGTISVTGTNTFTVNIDTTGMDAFVPVPANYFLVQQSAQVVPIAEVNATFRGATKNVLPSGNR